MVADFGHSVQLPGAEPDMSAATFAIRGEDHTIGNALRWILMKDPQVEFCGYSIPHPSESKVHLRIQMYDSSSASDALRRALDNMRELLFSVGAAYERSYKAGNFERVPDPKPLNLEELKAEAEAKRTGTSKSQK